MNCHIAIHHRPGSFSDRWIEFCVERAIRHTPVDGHRSDIIDELSGMDAFLWHWSSHVPEDTLCAAQVLRAAELIGLRVFPNAATCWSYDDKIAQKYLLEAIGSDLVPTHVFFDLPSALAWIEHAEFPKVFKLRRGAGSSNVRLVHSASQARRLAKRAFRSGFTPAPGILRDARNRVRVHRRAGDTLAVIKRLPKTLSRMRTVRHMSAPEKGYVYFQDFVPGNVTDARITVIGDRAFGYTRHVRPNDFRASGSGNLDYKWQSIDTRCIQMAFDVAHRLGTQSLAFDFVQTPTGDPVILEVSYCYIPILVYHCPGHWDKALNWYEGHLWPQDAILEDLLRDIEAGLRHPD